MAADTKRVPSVRKVLVFGGIAVLSFIATLLFTADRLPALTHERLEEARTRWRAAPVPNYTLRLETEGSGLETSVFDVVVAGGGITRFEHDGAASGGDSSAYTVDGLFGLLERELELATEPSRSYGAPAGYSAHLMARFDDANGVPLAFRRVVGGTGRWVEWRVVKFEEDAAPASAGAP